MKTPKTFLVGITQPDRDGLWEYLEYTGQEEFMEQFREAQCTHGEAICLVSFYAKLCYKSLVLGMNANVTKTRDIEENIHAVMKSGHGSVLEHVWLNFVTTDCSRVFTHELVRHRVGTAFSQTSGRYVAIDQIELVLPPDLRDQKVDFYYANGEYREMTAQELVETQTAEIANTCQQLRKSLIRDDMPFADKKRITSAIRRLAPNGQTNEIGWSCNVRSLRHMLEMRTSRAAEWEIRVVFAEVAEIIAKRWPLMLYGGKSEVIDGIVEWTGLKV
jgi:thymidylate synthase (FAD)